MKGIELQTAAVHRLRFIETLLMEYGFYNRGTGARYFGVSVPQASIDLADYMRMAPANVVYNKSSKRYERAEGFKPVWVD
jgi:hypothetical protein